MFTATETRSAPVTPDSIVGTTIKMTASFDSAYGNQECSHHNASLLFENQRNVLLRSMLHQESLPFYQLNSDYLSSNDQAVSEKCRRKTCEWMYTICDYFKLNRVVVSIAIFYVDRYCTLMHSSSTPVTTRQFQLVALTSLFIAIKTHGEIKHQGEVKYEEVIEFNINFCASISRNQFTTREIEECEQSMLRILDWHVNPVVPSNVIDVLMNYITPTAGADIANDVTLLCIYECSRHLAELSISVPGLSIEYKPSIHAYACIMYALEGCEAGLYSSRLRSEFHASLQHALCCYFDHEKENIKEAFELLRIVCPNLNELWHTLIQTNGSIGS